jgi:hypothetical protein
MVVNILFHERILNDEEVASKFEFLGKIKHPDLVPLVGYHLANDRRIEIYDFMENGSLHHWLRDLSLGAQATWDSSAYMWEKNEGQYSKEMTMGWRVQHRIALRTTQFL